MNYANWILKSRSPTDIRGFAINNHVVSAKTQFQSIDIVDTYNFGRVLLLDNIPQSSEKDEFIYHEAIVHPALCAHPSPENVLVIGGGEGATIREVLKHRTVNEVVMVEVDEDLVDLCRKFLQPWSKGSFDDHRINLIYGDGREYLLNCKQKFDCIIVDLSDPFDGSPSQKLFTFEFYNLINKVMRDQDSIVALQAESGSLGFNNEHYRIFRTLRQVFDRVYPYYAYIPLYFTLYGFILCGSSKIKKNQLISSDIDEILRYRGIDDLRYFDAESALGMFSVPKYIKEEMNKADWEEINDKNLMNIKRQN